MLKTPIQRTARHLKTLRVKGRILGISARGLLGILFFCSSRLFLFIVVLDLFINILAISGVVLRLSKKRINLLFQGIGLRNEWRSRRRQPGRCNRRCDSSPSSLFVFIRFQFSTLVVFIGGYNSSSFDTVIFTAVIILLVVFIMMIPIIVVVSVVVIVAVCVIITLVVTGTAATSAARTTSLAVVPAKRYHSIAILSILDEQFGNFRQHHIPSVGLRAADRGLVLNDVLILPNKGKIQSGKAERKAG
mmetsp:Transcript_24521/g.57523  ORF Transcript_24521/g.57523 Transcript_24521/m.57523 type:complete len:247 (+) Transcript_24521:1011-1751(+)